MDDRTKKEMKEDGEWKNSWVMLAPKLLIRIANIQVVAQAERELC